MSRITVGVAFAVLLFAGCGSGPHAPYRTLPKPPLPSTEKPPPSNCGDQHTMGACLPQPAQTTTTTAPPAVSTTGQAGVFVGFVSSAPAITGPDLSNNDPVSCSQMAAIAHHSRFVYLKSVEGTGFYDTTAAGMAACARAVHLPAGAYDFLHVCLVSPVAEAEHFVAAARAQGLLGQLPLAGDAEYPIGGIGCSGRVWIQTWVDTVFNFTHRCPIMYTGAWWWQPHIGSYWPTCQNVPLIDWISGYGVRYPYMPSGRSTLDLWQFSDRGYNGATYADLSLWMHDAASFAAFEGVKPVDRYAIFLTRPVRIGRVPLTEATVVKDWDKRGCRNPVRRPACKALRAHLVLLRDRIDHVAHHPLRAGKATYGEFHRGQRRAGIERRLK